MSQDSESKNNKVKPMPVNQIQINIMSDGSLNVQRFPDDFRSAMQIMATATQAVAVYFVQGAAENRHDAEGRSKKSSIIVAPQGAIKTQ